MRTTLENNRTYSQRHHQDRYSITRQTLTGVYVMSSEASTLQFLNPGGVDRTVFLPAYTSDGGSLYWVANVGTGTLNVVDGNGVAVWSVTAGTTAVFLEGRNSWATAANIFGVVVGPSTATDNAVARFDGVTGKLIQNSFAALSDVGVLTLRPNTTGGSASTDSLLVVSDNTGVNPLHDPTAFANERWLLELAVVDGVPGGMGVSTFGTGNTVAFGVIDWRRGNGTATAITALKAGDYMGVLGAIGATNASGPVTWSLGSGQFLVSAAQDFTPTAWGTRVRINTTAWDSTTIFAALDINPTAATAGNIRYTMLNASGNLAAVSPTDVRYQFNNNTNGSVSNFIFYDMILKSSTQTIRVASRLSANLSTITDGAEVGRWSLSVINGAALDEYIVVTPGSTAFAHPVRHKVYTVATLPAGTRGDTVFVSDLRVSGEGAGVGTGGLATYNGTAWKVAGTNTTAVA